MNAATIAKLSHNEYAADVKAYLDAKATKKQADADSRKADGAIKSLRSKLFLALKGAAAGRCGNAVITVKPGGTNPGMLTLKNSQKIPISTVKEIVYLTADGTPDVVRGSDVEKWYGGAVVGDDLEITLTGDAV